MPLKCSVCTICSPLMFVATIVCLEVVDLSPFPLRLLPRVRCPRFYAATDRVVHSAARSLDCTLVKTASLACLPAFKHA